MPGSCLSGSEASGWTRGYLGRIRCDAQKLPDLSADGQPEGCPALARHTKIESTVRYPAIEVDDAPAIAEQVDV